MTNSRASSKYQLIGNYESAGAEASKTFTITANPDLYSKLIIVMMGEATAALAIEVVINAIEGTANFSRGFSSDGTTITAIETASAANLTLVSATMLNAASKSFAGHCDIYVNDIGINDVIGNSIFTNSTGFMEQYAQLIQGTVSAITSIKIQTSTSTWIAGTKISLYGLRK